MDILRDDKLKWLSRVWKFLNSSLKRLQRPDAISDNAILVRDMVIPVMEWCLVPVSFKDHECLYPVKKSRCVISFASGKFIRNLDSSLQNIGIPRPLLKYFDTSTIYFGLSESADMYLKILGTIDNVTSVLMALEEVVKCGEVTAKLSSSEANELLRYLSESLETWKNTPNSMHTVRHLPVFTTINRSQVALCKCCVYIIPSKIPMDDMESWTGKRGIIFLRNDHEVEQFEKLFQFLGCAILSETEVYCSYIFQHFELLSPRGQKIHLQHVKDKLLISLTSEPSKEKPKKRTEREEARDALLESLQNLAFIPTQQGTYECASQFYDNQNKVFLAMHESSEFPPEPYDSLEWNDFLKKCGMISCITKNMFLQYAREIEQNARASIDETLRKKSQILVGHLFARDDIADSEFMQKIQTIRFVPPHTIGADKETLHVCFEKKNARNQQSLIPFKNSITVEHADIVWSAQHVLPDWACPGQYRETRQVILTKLEIQEKAKLKVVGEHTKRLCNKWAPVAHELKPIAEIMAQVLKRIYAFLKSDGAAVSDTIGSTLTDTCCIFDIERCLLVKPKQVVQHMHPKNEIAPYLIRMPPEYGEFVSVFEALGSTSDATLDQYALVLEMIHDHAKDAILGPNEKEAVCQATKGFIALLQNEKGEIELDRELYLPGTDDKIHVSSDLVFVNSSAFSERLKHAETFSQPLLIDLNKECDISISEYELECLFKKLPASSQPQSLTSVVVEKMEDNFVEEDSEFVRNLEIKLKSVELKIGLIRLALHGVAIEKEEGSDDDIEQAMECLQNIKLVGVDQISTYLVYRGQRIEQSEINPRYYIREAVADEVSCTTIYICERNTSNMSSEWLDIFYPEMSRIIHSVTHNVLRPATYFYLSAILRCPVGNIDNYLDQFRIVRARNSASFEKTFRPQPGQFVPIELHHLLKQELLLLREGDFVAFQTYDPADDADSMIEQESNDDPTYIMVKILKALNEDDVAVNVSYLIEDGYGQQAVDAALLFAFHRTITDASDSNALLQVDDDTETAELDLNDAKRDIKQTLQDAWKLPEEVRKKYVKRLLLRWHPDKNPEQQQIATEATQYLFEVIDKLEKGLPLDDENTPYAASTYSNGYSHNGYYGAYYSYISKRAKKHRRHQEEYRKNYEQNTQNVDERRKRDFIRSFTISRNPQPGEGRRWLRQAEWDMKAAGNDGSDGNCPCGEWACFKYYQAALKAVKGARYAKDANMINTDNFKDIAKVFDNAEVSGWTFSLQRLVTSPRYMQYPTDHQTHKIPHDVFTDDKVQTARELSRKIVDWCKNYIG